MSQLIRNIFILIFVVIIFGKRLDAQVKFGQPFINNFSKSVYKAGTQNWDIDQNNYGIMFFANNDGLLEFNGNDWNTHKLPKKTICRSVLCDSVRVYVGGQSEIGFFEPNLKGELTYHSIYLDSSKYLPLTDVWEILKKDSIIIFFSNEGLVKFDVHLNQAKFYPKKGNLSFFSKYEDGFFIQSLDSGFFYFNEDNYIRINNLKSLENFTVSGLVETTKNEVIISTQKNGVFKITEDSIIKWETFADNFLNQSTTYKFFKFNKDFVISTSQKGVFILDSSGQIIFHVSKAAGLQNNNILVSFIDKDKNLWLGLDNGIDYVEINSPFSTFYPDGNLEGTSYAAELYENIFFAGTNNGLFYSDLNSHNGLSFKPFKKMKGQVWGINAIDSNLFISHHEGLFTYKDSIFKKVGKHNGSWLIKKCKKNPNLYFEGTYSGINIYEKIGDSIFFRNKVDGFNESSRFVCQTEEGYFWVAHPYKGIFKCLPNKELNSFIEVKKYDSKDGFPSDIMLKVFEINNQFYFTSEFEVFHYDSKSDSFLIDNGISKLFVERPTIRYLSQGQDESIWFVSENEIGLFEVTYQGIEQKINKKIFNPISGYLVNGFEFIKQISKNYTVMGAEKGMMAYSNKFSEEFDNNYFTQITSINLFGEKDSVLSERFFEHTKKELINLPSELNNISFSFSAPIFTRNSKVEYSYFLVGFDDQWSAWSEAKIKDYTNLPPRKYTFLVKSRVQNLMETEPVKFYFRITPPWYKSKFAVISYAILLLGLIYGLVTYQKTKYEKEKLLIQKQQEKKLLQKSIEHKNLVELNENEIIKLKNERLQDEISFKTKELASSTMHLVQKTEILSKIKTDLKKASEKLDNRDFVNEQIKSVIKLINENVRLDKNWDQFEIHFDQVHVEFNKKLKEKFPDLTPNDLKICAYLRMNLTTKEISPLMNISVRGVEISRYRLRKKLNLDRDINLYNFLAEI